MGVRQRKEKRQEEGKLLALHVHNVTPSTLLKMHCSLLILDL